MLLSRIAETVFWLGRYMERAEDTARLILGFEAMALDIPKELTPSLQELIAFTGDDAVERYRTRDLPMEAEAVYHYLISDRDNPGSIASAISTAREDLRASRFVAPRQVWELLNELHLKLGDNRDREATRPELLMLLEHVVSQCQRFAGIASSDWSHDAAHAFTGLGIQLERADMVARSIWFHLAALSTDDGEAPAFNDVRWMSALRSLSAYQMFRRRYHGRPDGGESLAFLLHDPDFPRSVASCLGRVARGVDTLPRSPKVLSVCRTALADLRASPGEQTTAGHARGVLRTTLKRTGDITNAMKEVYFH